MATIVANIAKVPGVALFQKITTAFVALLEKHNVPHWCDYMNEK